METQMAEYPIEHPTELTLAGYAMETDKEGRITIDSMDGRIWRIAPDIIVCKHSDGPCGKRASCGFLAGRGHSSAISVEHAIEMCIEDSYKDGVETLEFAEPDSRGVHSADNGKHAYTIKENYCVTCTTGNASVRGNFTSLLKAKNAVVRLIGTAFGY